MPKRRYQTPEIMHDAPLTDSKAANFHFDDFATTFIQKGRMARAGIVLRIGEVSLVIPVLLQIWRMLICKGAIHF